MNRLAIAILAACGHPPAPQPPQNVATPQHDGQHVIEGTLVLPGAVPNGAVIFVVAKPASGGVPLAVAKLVYAGGGSIAFHLDDSDVFESGGSLVGDVVVTARFDQDGDAITKQPGDLVGSAAVTVPAHGVSIRVDRSL
ncbi:MAG TPA: hypothetical protein VH143_28995 [Kofleriaceae bacterium]|jgi:hypothetical protein|nr:hypothetical protein [Kofleriaceae bacterium]